MKQFILTFIILAIPYSAKCYEIRTVDGKIQVPKYTFKGNNIWTDAEKDNILALKKGSDTISDIDFVPIPVPAADLNIINDLNSDDKNRTRTQALGELARPSFYGTSFSGTNNLVNYSTTIILPSYFESTISPVGRTIQITCIDTPNTLWLEGDILNGKFTVSGPVTGNVVQKFYWQINGVKK